MPLLTLVLATLITAPSASQAQLDAASRRHLQELALALANSGSPRDRALHSQMVWLNAAGTDLIYAGNRGASLRKAAEAAPNDRLVQWLWANAVADRSGCDVRHPCPDRVAALAILEPDNGAAWLPLVQQSWRAKDVAGTDAALARMAAATRYDDVFVEAATAWDQIYRRYPIPASVLLRASDAESAPSGLPALDPDSAGIISAIAYAAAMALPAVEGLKACDRDKNAGASVARFDNCGKIGHLMLSTGTTVMARRLGLAFLRVSHAGNAADADARRRTSGPCHGDARFRLKRGHVRIPLCESDPNLF